MSDIDAVEIPIGYDQNPVCYDVLLFPIESQQERSGEPQTTTLKANWTNKETYNGTGICQSFFYNWTCPNNTA